MSVKAAGSRVIVAEDEVDVLNLIAMHLTTAGYSALKAEDGESAGFGV